MLVVSLMMTDLNAQHTEQPFKIAVLFGPACTVGKPGGSGSDTSTLNSSLKTGFNAAITCTYRFPNSTFGIFGIGSWQRNPVNSNEYAKESFSTPVSVVVYSHPLSVVVYSNPLNTWKFLAGPTIKIPLGADGKLSVEFSMGGGVLIAIAPDYTINTLYNDGSGEIEYHYGGRLPTSFCYQFGSAFNYQINRLWSLLFNASYTHSTPSYYKDDIEYNGIEFQYTKSYPVRSLNLLAGISFAL
jgi:hypothetical protein